MKATLLKDDRAIILHRVDNFLPNWLDREHIIFIENPKFLNLVNELDNLVTFMTLPKKYSESVQTFLELYPQFEQELSSIFTEYSLSLK